MAAARGLVREGRGDEPPEAFGADFDAGEAAGLGEAARGVRFLGAAASEAELLPDLRTGASPTDSSVFSLPSVCGFGVA